MFGVKGGRLYDLLEKVAKGEGAMRVAGPRVIFIALECIMSRKYHYTQALPPAPPQAPELDGWLNEQTRQHAFKQDNMHFWIAVLNSSFSAEEGVWFYKNLVTKYWTNSNSDQMMELEVKWKASCVINVFLVHLNEKVRRVSAPSVISSSAALCIISITTISICYSALI